MIRYTNGAMNNEITITSNFFEKRKSFRPKWHKIFESSTITNYRIYDLNPLAPLCIFPD